MTFAVTLCALADKYDVPKLRDLAARKFKAVCKTTDVEELMTTINLVGQLSHPKDRTLWEEC